MTQTSQAHSRHSGAAFNPPRRRRSTRRLSLLLPALAVLTGHAFAQALPTASASPISTGFVLPRVAGTLQYGVSASETFTSGYYGNTGTYESTNLSGDVALITSSKTAPFSMIFSGGRFWSTSDQPSSTYLNLALSQVLNTRSWNFIFSDSVNYLPETPSTGLSGVPGVGDTGIPPVGVAADNGQGLLTVYSDRVANTTTASVSRSLTGKTSLQATGSYYLQRFLQESASTEGLDNDGDSGSLSLRHRFNSLTSLAGIYSYTKVNYGANEPGFSSQTASIDYTRQLTRRLAIDASAGPQWSSFSNSNLNASLTGPTVGTAQNRVSLNVYANASATYTSRMANFGANFTRSTNAGSGVIAGARSDSVGAVASRTFARVWNFSLNSSYTDTSSLVTYTSQTEAFHTTVGSLQLSRAIGHNFSAFGSYTLLNQSGTVPDGTFAYFSGLSKIAAFGLTYSPTAIHLGSR